MSTKRKAEEEGETTQLYTSKRRQPPKNHYSQPRWDPQTGQATAFPDLDDRYDYSCHSDNTPSAEHGGLPDDPLAYLKSVRHEAAGIPSLLVAPSQIRPEIPYGPASSRADDTQRTAGGHFLNGVYIADLSTKHEDKPMTCSGTEASTSMPPQGNGTEIGSGFERGIDADYEDPQDHELFESYYNEPQYCSAKDAYTRGLLDHFAATRDTLRALPPYEDPNPSPEHLGIATLKKLLTNRRPHSTVLNAMSNHERLRLLKALTRRIGFNVLSRSRTANMHKWAWALLLHIDDVGTLSTDEVGMIRDLGKRALVTLGHEVDRQQKFAATGEKQAQSEEDEAYEQYAKKRRVRRNTSSSISNAGDSGEDETPASVEEDTLEDRDDIDVSRSRGSSAAMDEAENDQGERYRSDAGVDAESDAQSAAYFTLDMIITIVGECYGQRDLLDGRILSWMPVN